MPQPDKMEQTRERILDEAEILFSQKGYHAVSIREITSLASCNLAAVNYHFGNKENLYLEVFRNRLVPRTQRIYKSFRQHLAAQEAKTPDRVIHAVAQAFLDGPLTDLERRRHHQLIMREISEPTAAFEIIDQAIRPMFNDLCNHLGRFNPVDSDEKDLNLKIISVMAMVFHFNFAREMVQRLTGSEYNAQFKNRLIDHIVDFSLKGLRFYPGEKGSEL